MGLLSLDAVKYVGAPPLRRVAKSGRGSLTLTSAELVLALNGAIHLSKNEFVRSVKVHGFRRGLPTLQASECLRNFD